MFAAHLSEQGTTAIVIPPAMALALLVLTVLMCVFASVVSIHKVTRIDPVMVFKG